VKLPEQFDPAAIFEEFFERVSRCFPFALRAEGGNCGAHRDQCVAFRWRVIFRREQPSSGRQGKRQRLS